MAQLLDNRIVLITQLRSMEIDYVKQLQYLFESYLSPLKQVLSQQQHHILFSNLERIMQCHQTYLNQIEYIDKTGVKIGDIALAHCQNITSLYATYSKKSDQSQQLLQHLFKHNAKFFNFCQNVHQKSAPQTHLDLPLLLKAPLNYVQKLYSQLNDILVNTPSTHSDHIALSQCLALLNHANGTNQKRIHSCNEYLNVMLSNEFLLNEQHYIEQMKQFYQLINPQNNHLMFNLKLKTFDVFTTTIDAVYQFHTKNLQQIKSKLQHKHSSFVDIWQNYGKILCNYQQIIAGYDKIDSFFAETLPTKKAECMFFVQIMALRIHEYLRLFESLSKHLSNNHCQDFIAITNVINCIKSLQHERKAMLDKIYKVYCKQIIESKLDTESVKKYHEYRSAQHAFHEYIFDGYLMKLSSTVRSRNKIHLFVLYTDSLMYCSLNNTNGNNQYNLRCAQLNDYKHANVSIHIHNILKINDTAASMIDYEQLPPDGNPNGFALLTSTESFLCCAPNIVMKQKWCNLLNARINQNYSGNVMDEFVRPCTLFLPYSFSDTCMMDECKNRFNDDNRNSTVQRMHCRSCGRIVCAQCCGFKMNSYQTTKNHLIRVCKDCKTECDEEQEMEQDDDEDIDLALHQSKPCKYDTEEDDDLFSTKHKLKTSKQDNPKPSKKPKVV